jgi:hypothetical protein
VGPVAQAAHTLGVVTRDGVTERLPLISARRAASARDSPSSAWAIAYARDALCLHSPVVSESQPPRVGEAKMRVRKQAQRY